MNDKPSAVSRQPSAPSPTRSIRAKAVFVLGVLHELGGRAEALDIARVIRWKHSRTEFGADSVCSSLYLLESEGAAERLVIEGRTMFRAILPELPDRPSIAAVPEEERGKNCRGHRGTRLLGP